MPFYLGLARAAIARGPPSLLPTMMETCLIYDYLLITGKTHIMGIAFPE